MVFGSCDLNQDSPPSIMDFAQVQGAQTVPPGAWLCKYPRDVTAGFCHPSIRGGKAGAVSSGTDNSSQQKGKVTSIFHLCTSLALESRYSQLTPVAYGLVCVHEEYLSAVIYLCVSLPSETGRYTFDESLNRLIKEMEGISSKCSLTEPQSPSFQPQTKRETKHFQMRRCVQLPRTQNSFLKL